MEREEVKQILMKIDDYYGIRPVNDVKSKVDSWTDSLKNEDYDKVVERLERFVDSGNPHPPTPGQLKSDPDHDRVKVPSYVETMERMEKRRTHRAIYDMNTGQFLGYEEIEPYDPEAVKKEKQKILAILKGLKGSGSE